MKYNFEPNINGRQILAIGESVLFNEKECTVCHIHQDGLVNIQKANKEFILGLHPNILEKIKWASEYVECNCCAYKWAAVYHSKSNQLCCPNCNNDTLFNIIPQLKP